MWRYSNPSRYGKYTVLVLALLASVGFVTRNYVSEINLLLTDGSGNLRIADSNPEDILYEFYKLVEPLDILPIIIEPGLLFNSLKSPDRGLLMQKGFTVAKHLSNFTVISVALIERRNEMKIHVKLKSIKEILEKSFKYWTASRYMKARYWRPPDYMPGTKLIGHHFFQKERTLIHGVVFYERQGYLWHVELRPFTPLPVTRDMLTFTKSSAYERFDGIPKYRSGNESYQFYVPSQTTIFLMEIASSRFLECDLKRASRLEESDMRPNPRYNTLKDTFTDSHSTLKSILYPLLKMFFLSSGTLLGWYRQCDIIPYTHDIDFAAWSSDIGDEQFWIKTFTSEENPVRLITIMGLPEKGYELSFGLYGKKVDLFFIYRNESMSWAYGHRPELGYFFSYNYPNFKLCTGDLLGSKVFVPCNTEEVIMAEYGPDWRKPVSAWYYESDPRNMGRRQYWTNEEKSRISKF